MALREWPGMPIAKIFDREYDSRIEYPADIRTHSWATGDAVHFYVEVNAHQQRPSDVKVIVEELNVAGQVINTRTPNQPWSPYLSKGEWDWLDFTIPISNQPFTRFRIGASIQISGGMGSEIRWDVGNDAVFSAFIAYSFDFQLDYIPISIVYCPPGQDMTNALDQKTIYRTIATIGTSQVFGKTHGNAVEIGGGVTLGGKLGPMEAGQTVRSASGHEYTNEEIEARYEQNSIALGYSWGTRLIADNQRAIGRAYWGPLGDLFYLIKNTWIGIRGSSTGPFLQVLEGGSQEAQVVVVPAHKLLRPSGDPVATAISPDTRRLLLELDPFITNLDRFFPPDGTDPDPSIPLDVAVDPYSDPSVGRFPGAEGNNRAARIATYSLSTGIELDLSMVEDIQVKNAITNTLTHYARVSDTRNMSSTTRAQLVVGLDFTERQRSADGEYLRMTYQQSVETTIRTIKSAVCHLIRNQNAVDLDDIEIWWDKIFSTFMFRLVPPQTPTIQGIVYMSNGSLLYNEEVELEADDGATVHTMTDNNGSFKFTGLTRGKYTVRCGGKSKRVTIPKKAEAEGKAIHATVKNARHVLDPACVQRWQLEAALGKDSAKADAILRTLGKGRKPTLARLKRAFRTHNVRFPDKTLTLKTP